MCEWRGSTRPAVHITASSQSQTCGELSNPPLAVWPPGAAWGTLSCPSGHYLLHTAGSHWLPCSLATAVASLMDSSQVQVNLLGEQQQGCLFSLPVQSWLNCHSDGAGGRRGDGPRQMCHKLTLFVIRLSGPIKRDQEFASKKERVY